MKKNFPMVLFAILLSTGLLAQQATNPAQPAAVQTPAAASALTNAAPSAAANTNAPTAKPAQKKSKKKKSASPAATAKRDAGAELKTVPLVAGPAVVIASNVNVRGLAGLKGEVLGRVTKGQPVTVLSEVTLRKSGPEEPSAWAKILLPTNIHVWVNSSLVDDTTKTVTARKLNVRGGPGENFSVLGLLKKGDVVKELNTKGEWTEIEAPADAFAFVAAQYLKQEPAAAPSPAPTEPAPAPATVTEAPPVAAAPTEAPTAPAPAPAEVPAATNAPPATAPAPAAAVEEPPPKRVVQREGIVRGTASIQAPTPFELVSPDNRRAIDYLYTTAHDLDLRRYKGLRIIVTGEEALDERWPNTPVITIQRIQVLE